MKQRIRLTEQDLHRIVKSVVNDVLTEGNEYDREEAELMKWENTYQEACDRLMQLKQDVWNKNENRNTPELQLAFDFMHLCSFARQYLHKA